MSWACLIHGHEIIRYDRQLAWECIRCLKQWPMAKELVSATGVYAKKDTSTTTPPLQNQEPEKEKRSFWPFKKPLQATPRVA